MPLDTRPPQEDIPVPPGKLYAAELLQPPPLQSLLWSGKRFSLSDMRSWCAAATTPLGSSQKGFMIFDQSGNQTRLLRCPFPLRLPSLTAAEPAKLSELQRGGGLEKGFREDDVTLKEFDENGIESEEMHEDTEEINALLYSDDDYDCESDDDDDDDDEVMSTGHSPYQQQVCNKRALEEIIDSPCSKRQKLVLDKVENISASSSSSLVSSTKLNGSGLSNEQSRKDKIRTALKILESIVPGAKGNEALSLLDEAIDYLKLLKRDLISTEIKNHC